jgi:hypothetical protein
MLDLTGSFASHPGQNRSGASDSAVQFLGAKEMQTAHVTPISKELKRERHWRHARHSARTIAALVVALASWSAAQSQSPEPVVVTNPSLPVTVTNPVNVNPNTVSPFVLRGTSGAAYTLGTIASSPLPASSGVYRFDSFYYTCTAIGGGGVSPLFLSVVAGPDADFVLPLPSYGGGMVRFWLRPLDQVQIVWAGGGPLADCTTYLYGELVPGSLETLQ